MVLVDSYGNMYDFYYIVTAVNSKGNVLGLATVAANIDHNMAGHFGTMCFTDANKIPDRNMSELEAILFLKNKYSIIDSSNIQVKAINIDVDEMNWAWAIKIQEPIQVTDINDDKYTGNIFCVNPRIFEISWMDDKSENDKAEFLDSLRIRPRFGLIDKDIFDDHISKKIKSLPRQPSKRIKEIYPNIIVLENMAQQYEK